MTVFVEFSEAANDAAMLSVYFMEYFSTVLSIVPSVIRLSLTVLFVGSFFLQTVQRPIMELWARVIESDKPVFTLLFSGVAAFAEAGQRITKIFW